MREENPSNRRATRASKKKPTVFLPGDVVEVAYYNGIAKGVLVRKILDAPSPSTRWLVTYESESLSDEEVCEKNFSFLLARRESGLGDATEVPPPALTDDEEHQDQGDVIMSDSVTAEVSFTTSASGDNDSVEVHASKSKICSKGVAQNSSTSHASQAEVAKGEPALDIGPGWTATVVERKGGKYAGHKDHYWRSPGGKKFRSRAEIKRFSDALNNTNGDENEAWKMMKKAASAKKGAQKKKASPRLLPGLSDGSNAEKHPAKTSKPSGKSDVSAATCVTLPTISLAPAPSAREQRKMQRNFIRGNDETCGGSSSGSVSSASKKRKNSSNRAATSSRKAQKQHYWKRKGTNSCPVKEIELKTGTLYIYPDKRVEFIRTR